MVEGAVAFNPGNRYQVGMLPMVVQIDRFAIAAINRFHTQFLSKGQLWVIQQGIYLTTAHHFLVLAGCDPFS